MSFESEVAVHVESTAIDVADDAGAAEVLSLFKFISTCDREAVDDDGEDQGDHDLVDDDHVDVLEDLEQSHRDVDVQRLLLLEQITHETVDRFKCYEEDETETVTQSVAVSHCLLFEQEIH